MIQRYYQFSTSVNIPFSISCYSVDLLRFVESYLKLQVTDRHAGYTFKVFSHENRSDSQDVGVLIEESQNSAVVFLEDSGNTSRYLLMRTIRHFIFKMLSKYGFVPVHASAVEVSGSGIAFVGDKRSGKTTSLLSCLRYGRASFIANDAVFIGGEKGEYILASAPTSVGLRKNTLEAFGLGSIVGGEGAGHPDNQFASSLVEKIFVSQDLLCSAFSSGFKTSASLKAMVFPIYDSSVSSPSLVNVSATTHIEDFTNNILEIGDFDNSSFALRNSLTWLNNNLFIDLSEIECYTMLYNERCVGSIGTAIYSLCTE